MKKRTKKTLSISLKVFVRILVASVLCAILYVSMSVISTAFFSKVVGYQVYEQNENQEVTMVEEYYYQPGDVIMNKDTMELADNQAFTDIREVPDTAKGVMDTISQVLMLIVLGIFPYHILWQFGNRDDTNVRYRGQREDPIRGLRIGCIAMIPSVVAWVLLVVSKYVAQMSNYLSVYRILAFPYLPYTNWLIGDAATAGNVALWRLLLLVLPLAVVPLVCAVAYRMGGNQFSIAEFLTFSKKKANNAEEDGEI